LLVGVAILAASMVFGWVMELGHSVPEPSPEQQAEEGAAEE
jgi:hypothetical protein